MDLNIVVRTIQVGDSVMGFDFNATSGKVVPGTVINTAVGFDHRGFSSFDLRQVEELLIDMGGNMRAKDYRISFLLPNCDMSHRQRLIAGILAAAQPAEYELCFWESFRLMNDDGNEVVTRPIAVEA